MLDYHTYEIKNECWNKPINMSIIYLFYNIVGILIYSSKSRLK